MGEKTSRQLATMNEEHERLASVSAEASSLRAEVDMCEAEYRKETARRGQLRARLALNKKETKARQAALVSQLNDAFATYHERALVVLGSMPYGTRDETVLSSTRAQLTSIGSALLDDCDNALASH